MNWYFISKRVSETLTLYWTGHDWVSSMQLAEIYRNRSQAMRESLNLDALVLEVTPKGVTKSL